MPSHVATPIQFLAQLPGHDPLVCTDGDSESSCLCPGTPSSLRWPLRTVVPMQLLLP